VADGLVERRAVGTELRYFKNTFSAFGMLEYDTLYSDVNMAMLQANYLTADQINLNFYLDHRKSPILTADAAFQAVPGVVRVSDLRNFLTSNQIYSFATNLAPTSDSVVFSAFKQLSQRWQLGGDVHANRTTSTSGITVDPVLVALGVQNVPPQTASGMSYGADMNLVGNNLIFKTDTNVINVGYNTDAHSTSESLSLFNIATFREHWKVNTALQLSQSSTDTGASSWHYSPQVTLSYSPKPSINFETQFGIDHSFSDQSGPTPSKSDTFREFMFVGFRWDMTTTCCR